MKSKAKGLYGSGLAERDWYLMKDAMAFAEAGTKKVKIPEHLKEHEAAVFLQEYLDGKKRSLNKAAQALLPGCDEYWLVLMKS